MPKKRTDIVTERAIEKGLAEGISEGQLATLLGVSRSVVRRLVSEQQVDVSPDDPRVAQLRERLHGLVQQCLGELELLGTQGFGSREFLNVCKCFAILFRCYTALLPKATFRRKAEQKERNLSEIPLEQLEERYRELLNGDSAGDRDSGTAGE